MLAGIVGNNLREKITVLFIKINAKASGCNKIRQNLSFCAKSFPYLVSDRSQDKASLGRVTKGHHFARSGNLKYHIPCLEMLLNTVKCQKSLKMECVFYAKSPAPKRLFCEKVMNFFSVNAEKSY